MRTLTCLLLCLFAACARPHAATEATAWPTSGELAVVGGSLHFEVGGSGPAVVFLHGGFGDRRMWDDQFGRFARQHTVVRYDLRGFGLSSFPSEAYSPAGDLLALLEHLGIERASLVGNSMGATLALDFALLHPSRVEKLVLVAGGPSGFPATPEDQERFRPDFEKMHATFMEAQAKGVARGVELWTTHPMVAVAHSDPRVAPRLRSMVSENPRMFRLEHWPQETMRPEAIDRLGDVRAPTLVIVGDADVAFVRAGAEAAAEGIPGAKLEVIAGADHLPQMEQVERFNRLLEEFLGR